MPTIGETDMTLRRNRTAALIFLSSTVLTAQCIVIPSHAQPVRFAERSVQKNKQVFIVQGAVRTPGVYAHSQNMSLLRLLTLAGGLAPNHGAFAYVFRALETQSDAKIDQDSFVLVPNSPVIGKEDLSRLNIRYEVVRVSTNAILNNRFDEPLKFQSGGIVNVPFATLFIVTGEVHTPGWFPYKPGMTLRQAISMAQGIRLETAANTAVIYRVDPQTCAERKISVRLDAVTNGEEDDIQIQPDDIIGVNSSYRGLDSMIPLRHLVDTSPLVPSRQ